MNQSFSGILKLFELLIKLHLHCYPHQNFSAAHTFVNPKEVQLLKINRHEITNDI